MLLLSQTLTAQEKQQVLDQAVTAGDNYHLDKSGPTGLSQTGPSQEEEEGEGEERQRQWIPKREPQFPIQEEIRQCLCMTLSGTLKMTRMNGAITISSTAFLWF
jgi:hypothetical protein